MNRRRTLPQLVARWESGRTFKREGLRVPLQSDLNAAAAGWNMVGKSIRELKELQAELAAVDTFAARVIIGAASQIIAVKRFNCAEE